MSAACAGQPQKAAVWSYLPAHPVPAKQHTQLACGRCRHCSVPGKNLIMQKRHPVLELQPSPLCYSETNHNSSCTQDAQLVLNTTSQCSIRTCHHLQSFPQAVQQLCPALLGILLLVQPSVAHFSKLREACTQLHQEAQGQDWCCTPVQLCKQILCCCLHTHIVLTSDAVCLDIRT